MTIVLKVLAWLLTTGPGQIVGFALLGLVAFGGWTWKVSRDATEAALAQVLKETQAESLRRLQSINTARQNAERRDDALMAEQAERQRLLGEIDALSKANDARSCIDRAGSLRLDGLRGRSPGARTRGGKRPAND